jgi:hypothetical protein
MPTVTDLNNETVNTTTKTPTEADVAALRAAARDLLAGDFVGVPLKFANGTWTKVVAKDKRIEIGDTEPFVVDMLSYACGWVKWENRKSVAKQICRPIDGFILPPRQALPDQDKNGWPYDSKGKRADPWQQNHQFVLKDATTDELVTWVTTSWYGRKAVGRLLDAYTREMTQHLGLMPVVLLSSRDQPTDHGMTQAPVLTIVEWRAFGDGASSAGSPSTSSTTPALEGQPTLALPAAKAKGTTASLGSGGDMDDEIPF